MKKQTLSLAIAAIIAAPSVFAVEKEVVVDISNNLYYSGLIPKLLTAPFSGSGREYYGHNIPQKGYPSTPIPWSRYKGTPLHDCSRNAPPINSAGTELWDQYGITNEGSGDAGITEVDPGTVGGAVTNTFLDDRLGCYGKPPEVVDVSAWSGQTIYIRVNGVIDDDTVSNYGPAPIYPVDPRGQLGSEDEPVSENGINSYSLLGVWAKNPVADLKAHVDAGWDSGDPIGALVGKPGFTVVGSSEFGVIRDLAIPQSNTVVDTNPADGIADEGTAEFYGQITVPADATHLILGYNAHKGGFYHHGDTRYAGQDSPLFGAVPESIRNEDFTPTGAPNPYLLLTGIENNPDTYTGDQGFAGLTGDYAAGDTRTVGVFMVTLSDQEIGGQTPPPANNPVPTITVDQTSGVGATAFTFNVTATNAGTAPSYSWDFDGDGQEDATGATATHTYSVAGTHTAKVTVTTSDNRVGTDTQNISISSETTPPPKATSGGGGAFGLSGLLALASFGAMRRRRRS
ncbi:MAG: PKD domain-containing protein [bacterium]